MKNCIPFLMALFLLSCGTKNNNTSEDEYGSNEDSLSTADKMSGSDQNKAVAIITGASGSSVSGTVNFTDLGNQEVKIDVDLKQISPGKHAIHLHENGDCSASDASSAGGHWNPTNMPHGKRGEGKFHKGDIANLDVGNDQSVSWSDTVYGWTIGGPDSTNILNKAVIIHSGPDDFTSQPSGNAGSRIACGVINQTVMANNK